MKNISEVITSKYISNFSLIEKKKNANNENIYVHICKNFYEGTIEDFDTYMTSIDNLTGKIKNLELNTQQITHISPICRENIIDACTYFLNNDEYGIIQIVLPNDPTKNVHYNEKDCQEIRNIVNSVLHSKYTPKEYNE